jgi:hypothetical protein
MQAFSCESQRVKKFPSRHPGTHVVLDMIWGILTLLFTGHALSTQRKALSIKVRPNKPLELPLVDFAANGNEDGVQKERERDWYHRWWT